jgi:hypothetical protein
MDLRRRPDGIPSGRTPPFLPLHDVDIKFLKSCGAIPRLHQPTKARVLSNHNPAMCERWVNK